MTTPAPVPHPGRGGVIRTAIPTVSPHEEEGTTIIVAIRETDELREVMRTLWDLGFEIRWLLQLGDD